MGEECGCRDTEEGKDPRSLLPESGMSHYYISEPCLSFQRLLLCDHSIARLGCLFVAQSSVSLRLGRVQRK